MRYSLVLVIGMLCEYQRKLRGKDGWRLMDEEESTDNADQMQSCDAGKNKVCSNDFFG